MLSRFSVLSLSLAPLAPLALSACSDSAFAPALTASVVSVAPTGGSTGVDPNEPIVVTFSHAMQPGMEQYAALHEGDVTGPTVPGAWAWSGDRTTLTFTPAAPLKPHTQYTLHLGGGMRVTDGGFVDYGSCVGQHGGQWATQQMMTGGMMSGESMMGSGWRHPSGAYGMVFTFTTA
jgi:hypothetical protein